MHFSVVVLEGRLNLPAPNVAQPQASLIELLQLESCVKGNNLWKKIVSSVERFSVES